MTEAITGGVPGISRELFGRKVSVVVTEREVPILTVSEYDPAPPASAGYASLSTPALRLRVAFTVNRKVSSISDTATIMLWNLGPENRAAMTQRSLFYSPQEPLRYVRIYAGHDKRTGIIFNGAVVRCTNSRQGPDWITTIEASAVFGQALLNRVDTNWKSVAGIPVSHIIRELLNGARFSVVKFTPAALRKIGDARMHDFSVSGSAYDQATRLIDSMGLVLHVGTDGATVYDPNAPVSTEDATQAIKVDSNSGLLGTPKVEDLGCSFKTLLDPRLRPGALIEISSPTLRSNLQGREQEPGDPSFGRRFSVWEVEMKGDTHGDDWYTQASAWFFPVPKINSSTVSGPAFFRG